MPYTITKTLRNVEQIHGHIIEFHNYNAEWIEDNYYHTKATPAEKRYIDDNVQMLYQAVQYITDKHVMKDMLVKLIPVGSIPSSTRRHIYNRFYEFAKKQNL
jgi:hypothetical protein